MGDGERIESEIKLRVEDAGTARAALRRLGAFLAQPRHFEDNLLFDDATGHLAEAGCLVRVRGTSAGNSVTFKGPKSVESGVKRREEIETRVDDAAALCAILERIGFRATFRYQKYREVYEWDEVEIVIDETPIGVFLEVEGEIADIHRAAEALGFSPENYVPESYAALFFAAGGQGDMVFA
jgi:adenylate cyclase class 2